MNELAKKTTSIYIWIMLALFPAFFTSIFHLTKDKRNFFLFFTFIYVCTLLLSFEKPVRRIENLFAWILLLATFLSTLLAENSRHAFFEMSGRCISGLCLVCCVLIYWGVQKYGAPDKILLCGWLAGSSYIYIFGILCACGLDLLRIQDALPNPEVYLTPLGNTNFNTCYVCLMLSPVLAVYATCQKRICKILCGLNLYIGFLFTIFIKTESSFLAIAAGFAMLGYFALEKDAWFDRYLQIAGIYLGAKSTIFALLKFFPHALFPFHGLSQWLLRGSWIFWQTICFLVVFTFCKWKKGTLRRAMAHMRRPVLYICTTGILCFIVCSIWVNWTAENIPENSFFHSMILGDRAFTNRGFIWKRTLLLLKEEPLYRKLFGNGLNCFYDYFLSESCKEESISHFSVRFLDPHNEWLQMAADMGLLGVTGYFGLLGSVFAKARKGWRENPEKIAVLLTLWVYLIQGLANAYSIYHLPLLFIFLGIASNRHTEPSKGCTAANRHLL